jgi:hypothetical protein
VRQRQWDGADQHSDPDMVPGEQYPSGDRRLADVSGGLI